MDQDRAARIRSGEGEGRGGRPEQKLPRRGAIADDEELAGARETQPTGHGVPNRGHGDDAGKMASPPRDKTQPGMARAAPAMTGSEEELAGALDTAIQATKCQGKRSGRDRRARGFSPRGKARTGKARGRRSMRR